MVKTEDQEGVEGGRVLSYQSSAPMTIDATGDRVLLPVLHSQRLVMNH
jgi:hypothetical protein